jgi:hypothetical protein
MGEEQFNARDVGKAVLATLGVQPGETIEIQTSRTNPLEIKVVRHPAGQEQKPT